jgi:hypothetical protein
LDNIPAYKQKSDKITFSNIKILPFKYGENTRFLKNYGISVQKIKIFYHSVFAFWNYDGNITEKLDSFMKEPGT